MSERQQSVLARFAQYPPDLEGGIELSVQLEDDHHGVISLRQGDADVRLRVAALSVPYPSGLQRLLSMYPDVEVVVVERAPRGLREAAREASVGYLDLAGRGYVAAPGLVYVAAPDHAEASVARRGASPFAPKASRVIRVLLSEPDRAWRLSDVAASAGLNPGNVHRALAALVDRALVERDDDAYVLPDAAALLDAWADQHEAPRDRVWLDAGADLRAVVADLVKRLGGDAVVSGEFAAEELAPYLPAERAIVHAFDPRRFAEVRGGRPPRPDSPRSLRGVLVDLADEGYGAFSASKRGLPLASAQQVYVDLVRDRGRGREAAEHLRRAVIGY